MNNGEDKLVIADPDDIRPARPIPQRDIDQVVRWHRELARSMLDRAIEIGCKLRCWHDLIPHGRWLEWIRINIPEISERSVQVYLKLWDNNELIKAHFKSAAAADLIDEPSIREALAIIPSKDTAVAQTGKKQTVRRGPVTIEVAATNGRTSSNVPDPTATAQITPDDLSLTAQQKLEQYKHKLAQEFHEQVNARVQEFLENTIMPKLQQEQAEARRIIEARKGIMDRKTYKKILSCLHPDRVIEPELKQNYEEAFRLFTVLEKRLLDEKNSPTQFVNFPKTSAEWDDLKRQANQRKAESRMERASKAIERSR
jgi:hypothetical protein